MGNALLAIFAVLAGVLVPVVASAPATAVAGTVPELPIISRGVPAQASDTSCSPARANDADYSTSWRSVVAPTVAPQWLAHNLSSVSDSSKNSAVVVWSNDASGDYWNANPVASQPRDYTIEANTAAGGAAAPATGWAVLATETGNTFHAREYAVGLAG